MTYVPTAKVNQYVETGNLDVKSVANDIYNVQFPRLLSDWLDDSKDIYFHGKLIPADQKNMMTGQMALQQQLQDYTNQWTMTFNLYNVEMNMDKDIQKAI